MNPLIASLQAGRWMVLYVGHYCWQSVMISTRSRAHKDDP